MEDPPTNVPIAQHSTIDGGFRIVRCCQGKIAVVWLCGTPVASTVILGLDGDHQPRSARLQRLVGRRPALVSAISSG